jgi:hypothetical protein
MCWVRANRRIGAWAALFAFAVQLTLSFGHIHLHGISRASPATVVTAAPLDRGAPAGSGSHSDANDFCAICATVGMVASSVLPDTARLALPVAHSYVWPREFSAAPRSRRAHASFQARAPPFLA